MITERGSTNRTGKALTGRSGLSVLLSLRVVAGILAVIIKPHGIGP